MDAQYPPVLHNIRVLEAVHHRLRVLKMLLLGAELKHGMVIAILNATPPTACNTATASNRITDKLAQACQIHRPVYLRRKVPAWRVGIPHVLPIHRESFLITFITQAVERVAIDMPVTPSSSVAKRLNTPCCTSLLPK